jgi:hypothetical protein
LHYPYYLLPVQFFFYHSASSLLLPFQIFS